MYKFSTYRLSLLTAVLFFLLVCPWLAHGRQAVVVTPHFRFQGDVKALVEKLADIAEQKRFYMERMLGPMDPTPITVFVASTNAAIQEITGSQHAARPFISGTAHLTSRRIVLSARGDDFFGITDVFVHELAHIALHDASKGQKLPLWFHEGVAMMLASEESGQRLRSIFHAVATNSLIPFEQLEDHFPPKPPALHLAYAQSLIFLQFLLKQPGSIGLSGLVDMIASGMPWEWAMEHVYRATPDELYTRFSRSFGRLDSWVVVLTSSTFLWLLLSGLFLFVYRKKRKRMKELQTEWEEVPELWEEFDA